MKQIIGVTMSWSGNPTLLFEDGTIYPNGLDKKFHPEYFKNGDWPCDPITGEKLAISEPR